MSSSPWLSSHPGAFVRLTWLLLILTLGAVWLAGARSGYVPCATNCGETFDALQYVSNYRLYGLRFGLLQDMATSPLPQARPFLYTHNVNLGGLVFVALDALGVRTLSGKQLFTLLGFGLGLLYVFKAVTAHTRSPLIGFCTLVLFIVDYEHVLSFGLNALRAWSWLALFGLLYHGGRIAGASEARARDRIALFVFAAVAFGIGYDFWICCLATIVTLALAPRTTEGWKRHLRSRLVWILLAFAAPVILRQIQVAVFVGPEFWLQDVHYSLLVKLPLANRLSPLPSAATIDAFYQSWHILRPPAVPARSALAILNMLQSMLFSITIPSFGLLSTVLLLALGLLGASTVAAPERWRRPLATVLLAGYLLALGALFVQRLVLPRFVDRTGQVVACLVAACGVIATFRLRPVRSFLRPSSSEASRSTGGSINGLPTLALELLVVIAAIALVQQVAVGRPELGGRSFPRFGAMLLSSVVAGYAVVGFMVDALHHDAPSTSLWHRVSGWWQLTAATRSDALHWEGALRLVGAIVVGMSLGLASLAPFSLNVYLKHQFPLIAAPMHVAKAILLGVALSAAHQHLTRWARWLARFCVVVLLFDTVAINRANAAALEAIDMGWIKIVKAHAHSTFAVSWIPSSVSVFTENWVVGVSPTLTATFLDRLWQGQPPFRERSELFLFGERDAEEKLSSYLDPDFWLYFPTDQMSPFDLSVPSCRADYLTAMLQRLRPFDPDGVRSSSWVVPAKAGLGDPVAFGGVTDIPWHLVGRVELVQGRRIEGVLPDRIDELYRR